DTPGLGQAQTHSTGSGPGYCSACHPPGDPHPGPYRDTTVPPLTTSEKQPDVPQPKPQRRKRLHNPIASRCEYVVPRFRRSESRSGGVVPVWAGTTPGPAATQDVMLPQAGSGWKLSEVRVQ